jgi:glycosyltransferase involved in cell wall biosynthesis
MIVFIHDYAGHPFQVDLSLSLAKNGHKVFHVYFAGDAGPKGNMSNELHVNLNFLAIGSKNYSKTNFIKRRFDDLKYGKQVADKIFKIKPDIVISGNTPTEAQNIIVNRCMKSNIKFVYWIQDFYSIAASMILKRKIPLIGDIVGLYYKYLDKKNLNDANSIIIITDLFKKQLEKWKIDMSKVVTIPNWGSLDEISISEKNNDWSKLNLLNKNNYNVIYSGTMALKHDPNIILNAAKSHQDIDFTIVGFGVGIDYIKDNSSDIENINILPIQPFSDLSNVLASADILVAVIEEDAGQFSVPSKILNYMCAGKPIVLSAPQSNLATKIINDANAGICVMSNDYTGFNEAITKIKNNREMSTDFSNNSRKYAENNFNIKIITQKFEDLIYKVMN